MRMGKMKNAQKMNGDNSATGMFLQLSAVGVHISSAFSDCLQGAGSVPCWPRAPDGAPGCLVSGRAIPEAAWNWAKEAKSRKRFARY
ncbi:hypothetical protein TRIATDRAFT_299614 [Trichoderma atroviride IMI 206040]|uniref:Uncharacterized protein n=1 Tax=Hypocrea atroviridis (strain ATCC 20476 / IMI 206040) TaxID=452589 RepID=G9NX30_HYPAI|nr:uncharacterized protein TRIATDRAFT_299614 [Trichoderma atroviride IMI 206040]EHK44683.1 hypothetical protein TRIATDRAFT_299614 [Trichoderma atroviride IMI 206040]